MQTTFNIPIIARGRIIEPGPDAIEYSGRAGAKIRCPDPHKHIHDLVLGDASRLSDLQIMPISEIIEFLVELGTRLRLKNNSYLQEAFELGLQAGGLTEPILRDIYETLPVNFSRTYLETLVDRTVGAAYLDGWVLQGTGPQARFRVRAIGTRNLHITAGNVPIVATLTVIRSALTKSDCLIKLPSNDPLTASAVARTMIDIDHEHPVVKHVAVAYWKGGDEAMESQICRTSRIDKITAWGGMSSMKHIQKFLVPGLDLVSMNPKLSMSIVGHEALESKVMKTVAAGIAVAAGRMNQTACISTRVVYVESETDDESLKRVIALGEEIYSALQRLPPKLSTPAARPNAELEAELRAIELDEESYWVKGDTIRGGVVVSRFSDRVDFHEHLNNRIVNLVPMPNLLDVVRWCDDSTQTVGMYPERLRDTMRNALALAGVQRMFSLVGIESTTQATEDGTELPGMPHDGMEPMRRMVRWVVDEAPRGSIDTSRQAAA